MALYGVRAQQAKNTMIVWRSKDWHGTSLHPISGVDDPNNPRYCQRGMSFVTSTRLPTVWKRYKEAREGYGEEEAARELFGNMEDGHYSATVADGLPKRRQLPKKKWHQGAASEPQEEPQELKKKERERSGKRVVRPTTKALASGMDCFKALLKR